MAADLSGRDSHFVFSLHLYQYSVENPKKGLIGGRSRLHLIDFGCCERTKTSSGSITLSGLGNVILGIFNGQRHLPFKESKVTQMLKECMGSYTCQATMLAHVTPEPSHYSETLHTTQLASRIHRMRRKKAAKTGCNSNGSAGSGSSDDLKMNRYLAPHRFCMLFDKYSYTTSVSITSKKKRSQIWPTVCQQQIQTNKKSRTTVKVHFLYSMKLHSSFFFKRIKTRGGGAL